MMSAGISELPVRRNYLDNGADHVLVDPLWVSTAYKVGLDIR